MKGVKKRVASALGANVILLGLVSLLNDLSSEMILPILPMFLTSLGGTGLTIGLIGGLMDGFPQLLKVFSGYFSDKFQNRKKFVFLGYLNSQIFKLLLVFSKSWASVTAFIALDKLGKGIREAPRDALISESMPNNRGKAFGIQKAFDTAGAVLGSIVVLILFILFGINLEFRTIILIAGIIGFTCLIPIYFVKDTGRKKIKSHKIKFKHGFKLMTPKLKIFILIAGIFALANFSYMFFILKSISFFGSNSFIIPIVLYVFFNIFYASLAIPFGKLADKIGRRKIIVGGYLLFSLVCLGFIFVNSLVGFVVLFIFYGIVHAMIVGNQRAFVANNSHENFRATSLGIFQTITGICAILSGIIAGFLFDINPSLIFIFGFSLSLISVILFKIIYRKSI